MPDAPEVQTHPIRVQQPPQVLNVPLPDQDGKKKDKKDDEGDKSEAQGYQHPANIINVIFGSSSGFSTKRAQKLTLREIMVIEPAI
jgi:hypothetical protein